MYKIAVCGKANSGKDTVAKIISKILCPEGGDCAAQLAFAEPIKKIAHTMFPQLPEEYLYGSSKYRSEIIPNAYKDGHPLTIRQVLIDIGTSARAYNKNIWIDALLHKLKGISKDKFQLAIIADVRFKNEYSALQKQGFYQIKLYRDAYTKIAHESETEQDGILDSQFNSILYNNGTLNELKNNVQKIVELLPVPQ